MVKKHKGSSQQGRFVCYGFEVGVTYQPNPPIHSPKKQNKKTLSISCCGSEETNCIILLT